MEKVALIELGNSALRLILLITKDGGYFDVVDELEEQIKVVNHRVGNLEQFHKPTNN